MESQSKKHDWYSVRQLERENGEGFKKLWQKTVAEIDALSRNFSQIIENKMKEQPEQVQVKENSKYRYYEYKFSQNGFDCELNWWKLKAVDAKLQEKAEYILWDTHKSCCYVRDIYKDPFDL